MGVFRAGIWHLDLNGNGVWDGPAVDKVASFGLPSDVPVVGDWNGTGTSKIGVFRAGYWFLDTGNIAWEPGLDIVGLFGTTGTSR